MKPRSRKDALDRVESCKWEALYLVKKFLRDGDPNQHDRPRYWQTFKRVLLVLWQERCTGRRVRLG